MERLLKKGYEVLFLVEPVDEYTINAVPEFEGKKFQNVAKEGLTIDEGENAKERMEELKKAYEPLTKWLTDDALKDEVLQNCFTWDFFFLSFLKMLVLSHQKPSIFFSFDLWLYVSLLIVLIV